MQSADLAQRRLVVAANRGPVSFHDDPSGEPVVTRGPGGLVTVLTEVLRHHPGTWVAAALGDEERRLAAEERAVEVALDGEEYRVRYVAVDPTPTTSTTTSSPTRCCGSSSTTSGTSAGTRTSARTRWKPGTTATSS